MAHTLSRFGGGAVVLVLVSAFGLLAWRQSLGTAGTVLEETETLSSTAQKAAQAKALFHLAGGHNMLQEAKKSSGLTDQSELKHKDKDALDILGSLFGDGDKKSHDSKQLSEKTKLDARGRQSDSGSAGGGVHENPELKKMKEREAMPPPTPAQALQGLIAGWSGAGWWQPCTEVCAPRVGAPQDKAAFHKFQACEQLCRKEKTESLKKVMGTIKTAAEPPHKPLAPRTIKKLSKHLLKWAEGQGLPAKLVANANSNIQTNMQVGQSIAGMLIAGWSGAGWWQPCAEVCAPSPGEKKTKANFNKFMACQSSCRRSKGEYLRGFINPKEVVKHMAHG